MTGPVHRTITGPIAALETALVEHVRTAKRDDPLTPVVILAGETLLRPYLRRRLVELIGPLANVHVLTARELGLALGEHRLIAQGRTPLPVLADGVLAHEAALTTTGYFDAVRNTPGFANALHRTLSDLQRAASPPKSSANRPTASKRATRFAPWPTWPTATRSCGASTTTPTRRWPSPTPIDSPPTS